MPTKTKKKKKSGTKRRMGKPVLNASNPIIPIGTGLIGLFTGPKLNDVLEEKLLKGKADGIVVGAVEAGVGLGTMFIKFGKKKYVAQMAIGGFVTGMGVRKLWDELGLFEPKTEKMNGYQDVPAIANRRSRMNGYQDVPAIAAPDDNGFVVTGNEGIYGNDQGYTVDSVLGSLMNSGLMGR